MESKYNEWMKKFMDSWKALDGEKTTQWLAENVEYYETPDGKPCNSWEEVLALWIVVPNNQKDITYSFKVLCATENVGIINWRMTRVLITDNGDKKQKIDGIFEVSLDKDNKCNYFKQWRYTVTE